MSLTDLYLDGLCSGPVGCAFLLTVEQEGLRPDRVVTPEVSCVLAARAVDTVDRWDGDHAEIVEYVLAQGPRLRNLAQALLAEPGAGWWFAPLQRDAQMWIGDEGVPLPFDELKVPVGPSPAVDRLLQLPEGLRTTSTRIGDLCSDLIAIAEGATDYPPTPPYSRYALSVARQARVFEVTGPDQWRALCTAFPDQDQDGLLTPMWAGVAREWDAVHLTFGGLLTADQVRVGSDQNWSELDSWFYEQTVWLRPSVDRVEHLPDLVDLPEPEDEIESFWYWNPAWDSDPKPWRTSLAR